VQAAVGVWLRFAEEAEMETVEIFLNILDKVLLIDR